MPFGGSVRFAVTAASIQVFPRPWDAAGSFRAQEKDALGSLCTCIQDAVLSLGKLVTPFHSPEFTQNKSHALPGSSAGSEKQRELVLGTGPHRSLPLQPPPAAPPLGPSPSSPLHSHHLLVSLQVIYNPQSWRTVLISDIAIPSLLQK